MQHLAIYTRARSDVAAMAMTSLSAILSNVKMYVAMGCSAQTLSRNMLETSKFDFLTPISQRAANTLGGLSLLLLPVYSW